MAAAGDRLNNAEYGGYALYEITDETPANGFKQAAMLVKTVDDSGATVNPGAPVLGAGTNSIGSTKDNGPAWTVVRTYTASADITTAAAITAAPTAGQKIYADDILVSSDTAMNFSIQMETSANVLAKVFIPANGTVQITLRDGIKGDAADKKLFGKASVAGNVAVTACYHSEA